MRARIIIIKNNQLALIERRREGCHFYVIPGGGVEDGETPEDAAIREAFEELGVRIELECLVAKVTTEDVVHHYFLANIIGGEFGTGQGVEMAGGRPERGTYQAVWMPIAEISKHQVYASEVAELIQHSLANGWGEVAELEEHSDYSKQP